MKPLEEIILPIEKELNDWLQDFEGCETLNEEKPTEGKVTGFDKLTSRKDLTTERKALDELMSLIGLEDIKEMVKREISYHRIMSLRRSVGFPVPQRINHLLLVGNPGCGKTTVARLIGKVYYEEGLIEKNIFIETNRAGLVGQFIGESEARTSEIINKAKGGILFIDEIYSLVETGRDESTKDFGKKVIDTLIPILSNPDSSIMVIGAGYPEEMKKFITGNSGLSSRFPTILEFKDFSEDQLMQIAKQRLEEYHFVMTIPAREKFYKLIRSARIMENCGNARMVATTIENFVIPRLCSRFDRADLDNIDVDSTSIIEEEDIPSLNEIVAKMKQKEIHNSLGFIKQ